jgi:hypothetical protein
VCDRLEPGNLVYDDVWAVGDGAVFAFERRATGNVLVGYDISSGVSRWQHALTEEFRPFHVVDRQLLAMRRVNRPGVETAFPG